MVVVTWRLGAGRYDTQVFLCQRGLSHWGRRVILDGYRAYDVTRGATLFGEAILNDAVIAGKYANQLCIHTLLSVAAPLPTNTACSAT